MTRRMKTVETPRSEARLFLGKAMQFQSEAEAAVAASRNDAAMLNAIHAAISGADAVAVALGGRRSADPDHSRAVDLLEEVASESSEVRRNAKQLRMLLARKHVVEYESRMATAKEAADAVTRAGRLVAWSESVLKGARL